MINVCILGSTGSIGTQTLDIIRHHSDKYRVVGLTAHKNVDLLIKQAKEFMPAYVGITSKDYYDNLKCLDKCIKIEAGDCVLEHAGSLSEADIVVCAVVGLAGVKGVISAIGSNKKVALANKETLVSAGEIVMNYARLCGVDILPVDSEHSAVWQCLMNNCKPIKRIILTASGGPFRDCTSLDQLKDITPAQAIKHPNWKMGKKISVDSATMMNKGLEIIEARWLFDTTKIDYIIQKESIVHSMVEYIDGSIIAQMSNPNMELPISLALSYPDRLTTITPPFDFSKPITFNQPNEDLFILPKLARQSLAMGGNASCILNSANESTVQLFLDEKIGFLDIMKINENILTNAEIFSCSNIDEVIEVHNAIYEKVQKDYKIILGSNI